MAFTKNDNSSHLPLTKPIVTELIQHRESQYLIFPSTVSKTTSFDISKAWENALKASRIGHCRFHELRHTSASNLWRTGRTLFEVGTLQGQSSTSMKALHSHLAIENTRSMVDAVSGALQ